MRPLAALASGRRSKWAILGVWLVLVAIFSPLSMKLADVTTDDATAFLPDDSQSKQVSDIFRDRFEGGETSPALIVYRREGGLDVDDRALISEHAEAAKEIDILVGEPILPLSADPPLVSRDGSVAFTIVPLEAGDTMEVTEAIEELRELPGRDGLDVHVTGESAVLSDITTAVEQSDAALLIVTAVLVLGLLLAIYRSPVLAFIPLIVVGFSYTIAAGVIYLLAKSGLKVDSNSRTVLLVLMFGAATDYCLLLVARYSADLRRTEDHHPAVASALERTGHAILASGLTVIGALLMLLFASLGSNRTLGPVNAIGIAVGLAASLTLLPAILAIAGRKGFWPSTRSVSPEPVRKQPELLPGLGALPTIPELPITDTHPSVRQREGIWRRVGLAVLKRPWPALIGCTLVISAGAIGLTAYEESANFIEQFRKDTDSTEGFDALKSGFPEGALAPTTVMIDAGEGEPASVGDAVEVAARLRRVDGVANVSQPIGIAEDRSAIAFAMTFSDDPYAQPAVERVERIRDEFEQTRGGDRVLLGDGTAVRVDYSDAASRDVKVIVPLVLAVILITLIVLLRALVAPLYLLASVVISFLGSLGVSLLIFKYVFGQDAFDPALPLFAFIFLVALGVDYNIFLMSRVREEALEHGSREGVVRALVATGPVITSAGLILAGTFAALSTLPLYILLEIGLTVALGVLVDTFLVRTVMVPALVRLVGDKSWWPSRPDRGAASPVVSGVYKRPALPPPPPPPPKSPVSG